MSNYSFGVRTKRWIRFSINYIKERMRGLDFSMVYVGDIQKNVAEFHGYSMTDEKDMKRMLKAIPVNPSECSFLDVGCGKGICMKCAVESGYGKVAGLDLDKHLLGIAKKNMSILKMDVRKFFNSIDKKILYKILKKRIKDEKLLWLIRQILSAQERQKGIEIGNYTSQTFANIYLNELDQYATRKLKIKNYYRYMDDIVILARNKNEAKEYLNEIKEFLQKKLELELNDKTNIFKAKQGVNFCGYKINEYRLKVRNKGKNKFKKKVKNLLKEIKEGNISSKDARQYLTGHLGYFEIANTYNLKQKNIFLQDELLRKNIIN